MVNCTPMEPPGPDKSSSPKPQDSSLELSIEIVVLQSTVALLKRTLVDEQTKSRELLLERDHIISLRDQEIKDLKDKITQLQQSSLNTTFPDSGSCVSLVEVSENKSSVNEELEESESRSPLPEEAESHSPAPKEAESGSPVPEDSSLFPKDQASLPITPERRRSICLQTDVVGDPDVYYFAGGRHVGIQTGDDDEEFGPLDHEQFNSSTSPVLIVQSSNDDGELLNPDMFPSCAETQTCKLPELEVKEATVTMPSGTATKAAQSPRIISNSSSKEPPTFPKSTFAEKAKKGMTLRLQTQAPHPPSRPPFLTGSSTTSRNRAVTGPGNIARPNSATGISRPGSMGLTSHPPPVNYRSNIASRYRTAAATKQQHQAGQASNSVTGLWSPSASPRAATAPTLLHTNSKSLKSNFTRSSQALSIDNSGGGGGSTSIGKSESNHSEQEDQVSGSVQLQQLPNTSRPSTSHTANSNHNPNLQQQLLLRSKSMINPQTSTSKRASSTSSDTPCHRDRPMNKNLSRFSMTMSPKTNSCTSILETLNRQSLPERKKVGEDGWETVQRTRTNRSRWSLSSCSSSNNDVVNGNLNVSEQQTQNNSPSSIIGDVDREQPTIIPLLSPADVTSTTDDESIIKETEAALDSALREEEAIEKELLQVEKDFEEIENIPSTSQLSPSPDFLAEVLAFDDDSSTPSYFIDIVNQTVTKGQNPEIYPMVKVKDSRLREKLMSPAKKPDSAETLRRHQAKLEKAEQNRENLLKSKYNRYVELSDKFKVLNENTTRLLEERAELVSKSVERRKRAEEKREQHLEEIKRKAHDEGEKTKEIAFINLIELQNKNYDIKNFVHTVETRLQTLQEERQSKLKERQIKTMGVLEKQNRIRSNWEAKLDELQVRRQKTEERINREKIERAKERFEMSQERAAIHSQRISAINAAQRAKKENLQKIIQLKQEETARRHEENMESIRQKAIELSHCSNKTSEENLVRICTLCNIIIQSEVQELTHLRCRGHLEAMKKFEEKSTHSTHSSFENNFGLKFISDMLLEKWDGKEPLHYDKKRSKIMKKHCKKLIGKLEDNSVKIPSIRGSKSLEKNVREMDRLIGLFETGKGSVGHGTSLERLLRDVKKSMGNDKDLQDAMVGSGVVEVVKKIFGCSAEDLPAKVLISSCQLIGSILINNFSNTIQVLQSSLICTLLDLISTRWSTLVPEDSRWLTRSGSPVNGTGLNHELLPIDPILDSATELLFQLLNVIPDPFVGIKSKLNGSSLTPNQVQQIQQRTLDIIGYVVCAGIVDRLAVYCTGVRGPLDSQPGVGSLLKCSMELITLFIYTLYACFDTKKSKVLNPITDPTQLLSALESSELAGAISMSYSLLLYQGAPTRPRQLVNSDTEPSLTQAKAPPPPTILTSTLVRTTFCLINGLARFNVPFIQEILGAETVSLQFRHISSQLLWQVVSHRKESPEYGRLINELLDSLGYFTIKNQANQITIQSGQTPTVFQQLCQLPTEYFEIPKLSSHFYPALIAGTFGCGQNIGVLKECGIQPELLNGFLKSPYAKVNPITKILFLDTENPLVEKEDESKENENGVE